MSEPNGPFYEEGDKCPQFGSDCCGRLGFPEPINCSCFQSAPCSVCTNLKLTCDDCGHKIEDHEHG